MEDNQEKHKKGPNLHKHLPQMHPQDTVTRNHQQRRTLAAKIARPIEIEIIIRQQEYNYITRLMEQ